MAGAVGIDGGIVRRPMLLSIAPHLPGAAHAFAGGVYYAAHVRALAQDFRVVVIAPATGANVVAASDFVDAEVHLVPVPPYSRRRTARLRRGLRVASDGRGSVPGHLAALRRSAVLREAVSAADVVEVHWFELAGLLPHLRAWAPRTPLVAVPYDSVHEVARARAAGAQQVQSRLVGRWHARRTRAWEPAVYGAADQTWLFSRADADSLRARGYDRVRVLGAPPLPVRTLPVAVADSAAEIVFVGAMSRPENSEGVRWYLEEVWPQVRAAVPVARTRVVGADPPAWLLARAGDGLEVTGRVPDTAAAYDHARVVVAPLLYGAGVKFKVVEALLAGVPVAATPVAANGIVDRVGAAAFACVTSSPGELAKALVGLLRDAPAAAEQGLRGREAALASYSWERSAAGLREAYAELLARTSAGQQPPRPPGRPC